MFVYEQLTGIDQLLIIVTGHKILRGKMIFLD